MCHWLPRAQYLDKCIGHVREGIWTHFAQQETAAIKMVARSVVYPRKDGVNMLVNLLT